MKNAKLKLTLIMVITTVILFLITFLSINLYQQYYIFDKAILSIENELEFSESYLTNLYYEENLTNEDFTEIDFVDIEQDDRLFFVESLFLYPDDGYFFLKEEEEHFIKMYEENKIPFDEITKINNKYGEYYVLITNLEGNYNEEEVPVIFYTDITIANNIVNKVSKIFYIMMLITVIVEGLAGIYLGARFENTEKKLKHFFQNASHELKSPLMSIQGYAEGINNGVIDDTKMASEVIIKKSNKMKLLIDEILNISKLDSKEYILKKELIDIRDIIEDSLDNFTNLIDEKDLEVKVDFASEKTEIKADSLQIYKAINTIIDNAVKYAESEIRITTVVKKSLLSIKIFNDGQHIKEENISHIFDRFYSVNDFSTGIGLAMAKEIILLTKGDITVSNVQGGVEFAIKLPLS